MSLVRAVDGGSHRVCLFSDGRAMVQGQPLVLPEAIVDASAGPKMVCMLGEHGGVYLASGARLPVPGRAISVSCGYPHILIGLSTGSVFVASVERSGLVTCLPSRALRVYAGLHVCAAICANGALYTWGTASNILGHSGSLPHRVPIPGTVVDFGFGRGFAVALTLCGQLYMWGFDTMPTPCPVYPARRYSRLAVGRSYFAASRDDRLLVHGYVGGAPRYDRERRMPRPIMALTGHWSSSCLRCEMHRVCFPRPIARRLVQVCEYRWRRRRCVLICLKHEQARTLRKRARACADGAWTGKLPIELWRTVIKYL